MKTFCKGHLNDLKLPFFALLILVTSLPMGLWANCVGPSLGSNPGEHCSNNANTIAGWVWEDWNSNGAIDTDEKTGISGVEVQLIDALGSIITTCTDPEGNYEFTGLTDAEYRIEFHPGTLVTDWAKPSRAGIDNGTEVQFKAPGDCANYAMLAPNSYCQDNPMLYTTCFVVGPHNAPVSPTQDFTDYAAVVRYPYNSFGDQNDIWYTMPEKLATHAEIGTTYGLAVDYKTATKFVSAFMRRGADFGPLGPGGIYKIDAMGVVTTHAVIPNTGTDSHDFSGLHSAAIYDEVSAPMVGRMSLGDLEMSPDKTLLYVTNLNNGHLYSITTDAAATVTDLGLIPAALNCGITDSHPFGLGFDRNGILYVGTVCGNQTSGNATVSASVYSYSGGSFNLEHNQDIYFQDVYLNNDPYYNAWDDGMNVFGTDSKANIPFQPMLADIAFMGTDRMMLGFRTRDGDMAYSTSGIAITGGGAVINFCKSAGVWEMESNSLSTCANAPGQWPNQVGPGGGFFYDIDDLPENNNFSPAGMGAIAYNESTEMVTTIIDPTELTSAGSRVLSMLDGSAIRSYEVYFGSPFGTGQQGLFGKLNGLGDIENECRESPLEIGNLVWVDINGDGIQNPGEPGIPGVNVSLYDEFCVLIATVLTDANGNYYFNDDIIAAYTQSAATELLESTNYYIVVGTGGQYADGFLTAQNTTYTLTLQNTGMGSVPTINDSDAAIAPPLTAPCLDGLPFTSVTTGVTGDVNQSFDFGFDNPLSLPLDLIFFKASEEDCLARLIWQTKNEEEIGHFIIESSLDGITFKAIAEIQARGGQNETSDYSFSDTSPKLGVYNYYRLLVVNVYGQKEIYTDLVPIKIDCSYGNAILYPNPSNNELFLDFSAATEDELTIEILDVLGRVVSKSNYKQIIGENQIVLDIKSLPNAEYILRTKSEFNGVGLIKRFTKMN